MEPALEEQYVGVRQLAQIINISPDTIYRAVQAARSDYPPPDPIPFFLFRGQYRFLPHEVLSWMRRNAQKPYRPGRRMGRHKRGGRATETGAPIQERPNTPSPRAVMGDASLAMLFGALTALWIARGLGWV